MRHFVELRLGLDSISLHSGIRNAQIELKKGLSFFFILTLVGEFFKKVVTLSTYSFVIACIFGRQYINNGSTDISIDVYFPLWTVLQILFYMGLLKVRD